MITFLSALSGFIVCVIFYFVGKKIKNKFLRGLIQILGVVCGFFTLSFIGAFSIDMNPSDAGVYYFYLFVSAAVIDFIIKKKKKTS